VFQGPITLRPAAFAAARRGGSIDQRPARPGTTVRYALSEAARVAFTVDRQRRGRRVGNRCVKPNTTNRRRPRCTRFVRLRGSFAHAGQAGPNAFRFTGRLSGSKLARGRYRLTGLARDAAGNVSTPKQARFRIVRR
jgi:hypothetical protein